MLENSYLLDVDIKHGTSTNTPMFRRGDTAVLRFRVHDKSSNTNMRQFDDAMITIEMPSGIVLTEKCLKESISGVNIARFEFKKIHTIEVGIYQIYLTLIKGADRVSVPPIPVEFEDNVSDANYPFIEVINELEQQLVDLQNKINQGISISEINQPNGIAGLDSMKKIPKVLLNSYFEDHIATSMYKDGAHGFKIDENGDPWVLVNGNWQKAQISEYPIGGGDPDPTPPIIDIDNGRVVIKFPEPIDLSLRKWDKGVRDIAYFQNNGNVITSNEFTVTEIGNYTFYYKLTDNREYVVVFQVKEDDLIKDTKTPIEDIPNGSIVEFGNIEWIVVDNVKRYLLSKNSVTERAYSIDSNSNFNLASQESIAYWLNGEFLERFNTVEKSQIEVKTWNTGSELLESASSVDCKIGMFSLSELDRYQTIIDKHMNNSSFFSLITQDSSSALSSNPSVYLNIWYAKKENNIISSGSIPKQTSSRVRAALYLAEGTKLDIYEEDENVPLSQFNNGDVIAFSNKRWVLLDKDEGLLMYHDDNIYRTGKQIMKWLSSDFYYSLTSQARTFIQNNKWNTNRLGEPLTKFEDGMIGLLAENLINKYKTIIDEKLNNTNIVLTTNRTAMAEDVSWQAYNPKVHPASTDYIMWDLNGEIRIVPIVKVAKNTTVGALKTITKYASDVSLYEEISFGGYTWFKGVGEVFILKTRFQYDQQSKILPYNTDINEITYSTKDGNIGNFANKKFLGEMLFAKDRDSLEDINLKIGFVNDESSQIGAFKVGLIPTNRWASDYSLSSYEKLGFIEDFWLLNKKDKSNGSYVDVKTGIVKSTDSTNDSKLFKPVIMLDINKEVTVYEQEKSVYANVPDPELRKIMNFAIDESRDNINPILLEDVKKITFFDTVTLGMVKDLTGMELLTNCTMMRIAPFSRTGQTVQYTDMSPLIELAKGTNLVDFYCYGFEDPASLQIMKQLIGKMPNLVRGGVYSNAFNEILISLGELKGVAERIWIDGARDIVSVIGQNGVQLGYVPYITARTYSKNYITKIKRPSDSSWVEISPVSDYRIWSSDMDLMPSLYSGTDVKTYTFSFMDSAGGIEEFNVFFDANFIYTWTKHEQRATIASLRKASAEAKTLILPLKASGVNIKEIGSLGDTVFDGAALEQITIPASYEIIRSAFYRCEKLHTVTVQNDNIQYTDKKLVFKRSDSSQVATTLKAGQNSTTFDLYNYKISSENSESDYLKTLYKFAIR